MFDAGMRITLAQRFHLFDLCLLKHVLTVRPVTSALACLITKQCLMVFGGQKFPVCPGPYLSFGKLRRLSEGKFDTADLTK